ncbi:hypothetical protein F3G61_32380, partial [Pseudomonas aeruginosa]
MILLLCPAYASTNRGICVGKRAAGLRVVSCMLYSLPFPGSHGLPNCLLKSFLKFKQLQAPTHSFQVLPLFGASYDSLLLSPVICFSLGIEKSDFNANENFNCNVNSKWPNWHQIYTDASKHSSGCVGV